MDVACISDATCGNGLLNIILFDYHVLVFLYLKKRVAQMKRFLVPNTKFNVVLLTFALLILSFVSTA